MHPQRRKTSEVLFSKFHEENKRSFIHQPQQELKDDARLHLDMANRVTHNVTKYWPSHHLSRLYHDISPFAFLFFLLEMMPFLQWKSGQYILMFGFFHVIGKQFWLLTRKFELACFYLLIITYFQNWILTSLFNQQSAALYYSLYLSLNYYWDYYHYDQFAIPKTIKLMNLKNSKIAIFSYTLFKNLKLSFLIKQLMYSSIVVFLCYIIDQDLHTSLYYGGVHLINQHISLLFKNLRKYRVKLHLGQFYKGFPLYLYSLIHNEDVQQLEIEGLKYIYYNSYQMNQVQFLERIDQKNNLKDFVNAYFDTKIIDYSSDLCKLLNRHERAVRNERFLWQRSVLSDASLISQRVGSYWELRGMEKEMGQMIQFYLMFLDVYERVCKERDIRDMQAMKKVQETMKAFEEVQVGRMQGMKGKCKRQVGRFKQMIQFSQMNKY